MHKRLYKKISRIIIAFFITAMISQQTMAADFTDSITIKPAPDIVETEEKKDIIIYDDAEEKIEEMPSSEIIVTPISEVDNAPHDDIKENLGSANDKISSDTIYTVCPDLEKVVSESSSSTKEEDLVIKDLFHLAIYGDYKQHFEEEGDHIYLTFKVDIPADEPLYVTFCPDGGKWQTVKPQNIIRNEDGTVTIRFDQTGTVAFIQPSDPKVPAETATQSTDTTQATTGKDTTETKKTTHKKKTDKNNKDNNSGKNKASVDEDKNNNTLVTSPQTGYEEEKGILTSILENISKILKQVMTLYG